MPAPTLLTAAFAPRRLLRTLWRRPPTGPPPAVPPRPVPFDGLVRPVPGPQRRGRVRLRQVDGTTCGAAVLVVLRAGADRAHRDALAAALDAGRGEAFDEAQRRARRESRRFWPAALGTTPWGVAGWLRRTGAGDVRVRLVDAADRVDLHGVVGEVDAALAAGHPVPLLVGAAVPRHWCLALPGGGAHWPVFEPTSGEVRVVAPGAVLDRALRPLLGYPDLQAALLPAPRRAGRRPLRSPRPRRPRPPGAPVADRPSVREPDRNPESYARVNRVLLAVLKSPLARVLPVPLVVLRYTGRKTGRRIETPVALQELDGRHVIVTRAGWRANFRGGAPLEVVQRGRTRRGAGLLIEDPDEVVPVALRLFEAGGGRALGLEVDKGHTPTREELLVTRTTYVRVDLED